jgi:CNT family concentrative nucleoside transporter
MTNSELMTVMTGGFATIAGAVMAAYAVFLQQAGLHEGAGHLLVASVISAPAAIIMAKIMFPETGTPATGIGEKINVPITDVNMLDAATRGASEGLRLAANVGAMLLVFIAFIALFNWMVGSGLDWVGIQTGYGPLGLSLEKIFGWVFAPLAWVMGVPWQDCSEVGNLLGQKTIINEFVAYLNLAPMIKNGDISAKSQIISIYALCGFSNLSSIAIQIGGIGTIAPTRRGDLARLGFKAMIAGSLACFMTATVAGILI